MAGDKLKQLRPPRGADLRGLRVGLLGGSFNPAHDGHRHISLLALELLRLDQLWWLISPQNPLKPEAGMAPVAERLAAAESVARDPRIWVSDIESELETRHTADTVRVLKRRFPDTKFVWIMGADNLVQIPEWENWTAIFATVPVAIFDRPSYSSKALAGKAARRLDRWRVDESEARGLADRTPPAWTFFHTPLHPASATRIRAPVPASGRGRKTRREAGKRI